jgi:hypothetical protein
MELAFVPATTSFGKVAAAGSASVEARVKARIRRELGEPHVDVLWRLSTRPWARARTAVARPLATRLREWIEGVVVIASTVGMSAVAVICIAHL